jgi:hypothetical protein
MFTSSICKHINKWGKNKGNICNKKSAKKDSRCHKHRYRYLQFLNRIYLSFKHLFNVETKIIKDKKILKKLLFEKKEQEIKDLEIKLKNEKKEQEDKLKIKNNETFYEYINRIDIYTELLLKTKNKDIVHNIVIDKLYNVLNSNNSIGGSSTWVKNSNLILRIQRKYDFF